jgi:two-component system, cell cycle response regulator DivK
MTNYHALIIDDQIANLKVLAKLLEQQGVSQTGLTSAIGVEDAIDQLEQIDVVFVDLELPGEGDFFDAFYVLRNHPRLTDVPIIAYTVHISEIDATRQVGFDGFIAKPIKAADFPTLWQRILDREPVWVY